MITIIAEYLGLALIPAFILLDLFYRHRKFDSPRFWRVRALIVTVATFFLSTWVAVTWGRLLEGYSLFDGTRLGTAGGALAGVIVYELVHYWYHRLAHGSNLIWRAAHQMHHSAESLDAWGAYYLHPIDTVLWTTWSSLVFFPLLGLTPAAGAIAAAFLVFNAMFQHANIRTPRWLGYVVQRPESHSIHHERGVHAFNYSDLPLWDMVFGTFRNPSAMRTELGFYKGASSRIPAMLAFRDVSAPRVPAAPEATRNTGTVAA